MIRSLLICLGMSTMLLIGCAELPFARVRGNSVFVNNPTGQHVIAKVTCSCRVFDGEYDRYFSLEPLTSQAITVEPRRQHELVCAVESYKFQTPEELRLEVEIQRGQR